eukprot:3330625-Prymnesium_polylepis.1
MAADATADAAGALAHAATTVGSGIAAAAGGLADAGAVGQGMVGAVQEEMAMMGEALEEVMGEGIDAVQSAVGAGVGAMAAVEDAVVRRRPADPSPLPAAQSLRLPPRTSPHVPPSSPLRLPAAEAPWRVAAALSAPHRISRSWPWRARS